MHCPLRLKRLWVFSLVILRFFISQFPFFSVIDYRSELNGQSSTHQFLNASWWGLSISRWGHWGFLDLARIRLFSWIEVSNFSSDARFGWFLAFLDSEIEVVPLSLLLLSSPSSLSHHLMRLDEDSIFVEDQLKFKVLRRLILNEAQDVLVRCVCY